MKPSIGRGARPWNLHSGVHHIYDFAAFRLPQSAHSLAVAWSLFLILLLPITPMVG
jgi:hypothetical protein